MICCYWKRWAAASPGVRRRSAGKEILASMPL
jgi:hypothetical protein